MALITNGIDKVRAFELPAGIWADGVSFAGPRVALVTWRSSWADKFYQVYVNSRYAGVTVDTEQRQMVVQLPRSSSTGVRIEVFAVEAEDASSDFSGELNETDAASGRVQISMLREQSLPAGSTLQIYFDNGTGTIDYDNPLNDSPISVWPVWQDKTGFGMSRFGFSDFGFDASAAIGFGKGNFGYGEFGLDADTIEWVSEQLLAGVYKFAVKVIDEVGNESSASETGEITVIPAATPADQLAVSSFNKVTNQLVLSIS